VFLSIDSFLQRFDFYSAICLSPAPSILDGIDQVPASEGTSAHHSRSVYVVNLLSC